MLLQPVHINAAMSLDAAGVTFALKNNDMDDTVKTASYVGMTANGSFVYHCTFFNDDTCVDEDCSVFVYYTNLCKLVADY